MVNLEDTRFNMGGRGLVWEQTFWVEICVQELFGNRPARKHKRFAWLTEYKYLQRKCMMSMVSPLLNKKAMNPMFLILNTLISISLVLMVRESTCVAFVRHKESKQKLSQECWDLLQYDLYDNCPDPTGTGTLDLARFQELCCNSSNVLKFHCQADNDILFPACLPEETCVAGYSCRIIEGNDGFPKLKQEPCEDGHFESENRSSISQLYPFCRQTHSQCKKVGQDVFCLGDRTQDTQCMCKDSYSSREHAGCDEVFTDNSACYCTPSKENTKYCLNTSHSQILFCTQLSAEQLLINMTICQDLTKPPSNITQNSPSTTQLRITRSEQPINTPPPQAENNKPSKVPAVIVTIIFLTIILLVIIFRKKIKAKFCEQSYQQPRQECGIVQNLNV